ncbi:MAG: hypothetical protein M3134_02540 [Actinomycetota bacterium]|nr:hypothetical protein [Actinomycetota bacterium]
MSNDARKGTGRGIAWGILLGLAVIGGLGLLYVTAVVVFFLFLGGVQFG